MLSSTSAFLLTLLAVVIYGCLHSLLASQWAKSRAREAFGEPAERLYRLAYNLIGGITLLPVVAIPAVEPGPVVYRIPPPWVWFAVLLQVGAAAVILIGLMQTGLLRFLGLLQLRATADDGSQLEVGGLYRWVRHPLYAAGLIFIWLLPVMTTSLLALNLALTAYIYVGSIYEERKLERRFGRAYQRYRKRVPRLIPRPWRGYLAGPDDR